MGIYLMSISRFIGVAVFLFGFGSGPSFAQFAPCNKDDTLSEHAWNPPNSAVTPRLHRFYDIGDIIEGGISAKKYEGIPAAAEEYLALASVYRCNWNYGNAIHDANTALGLRSLSSDKVDEAKRYLLAAAVSPGSPQLNTFGPDLSLADALLQRGAKDEVVTYLRGIKKFWRMDQGRVSKWLDQIDRGERPALSKYAQ
jgi:hypothetical protein